jgi:hypothetical protein
MAAWLPVVTKAIPVIAQIVNIAAPMLTKRSASADRETLMAQQIEELQIAATQNSESVKALAAQVKTTFEELESAAVDLQLRLDRQQKLSMGAAVLGFGGLSLSLYTLLGG